jgi:hypothetical protein
MLGDRARADVERAGDRLVGAASRGEPEDLYLAVGQRGHGVGLRRRQRGTRALPVARPPQRVAQRRAERGQHGAIIFGKVPACPVQRDRREPAVLVARQVERDLVLDRNVPKKF